MASPRLATPPRGRVTRVAAPPPAEEVAIPAGFNDTFLLTHFEVPQRLADTAAVAEGIYQACIAKSKGLSKRLLVPAIETFVKGLFPAWKRDADKLMNLGVAVQREREAAPVSDAPVSDAPMDLEAEEGIDDPPSPGSVTADSLLADLAAACGGVLENAQVDGGQVQVEIKLTSPGGLPSPLDSLPDTPISNFISRVVRTPP